MKEFFSKKTNWIVISTVILLVVIPIAFFVGISYLAPVILIAGIFYYINFVRYEPVISPKEFEILKEELKELEDQANLIREHLDEYGNDLQAKFELREIEKIIEETKKEMGL